MKKHAKKIITALLVIAMLVPTVAMLIANAATSFTVELAFDNLFVFDHWVTNGNSMIIDNDFGSTNAGSISNINLDNGSFKFTNNTNHNIYTRAAAGTGEKTQENFDYYRMPVEEGATYTFSCNFTGTSPAFYPHVFYYTESNEFTGTLINGNFSGEGDHSFNFTVPAGAKYIQLRLAIAGNEAKNAYAVIKDIAISRYKFELDSTNLFSFDSWAASSKSNSLASDFGYNDGTVTADASTDTITMVTNTGSSESGNLFTSFSFSSNSGYYSIDVEPNTTYTLSYNIADGSNALHFSPYIVRNRADGSFIDYIGERAVAYGVSNFTFTTTAETEYISVVFSTEHQNQNWTLILKDIGVYRAYITDYTVDPVRKTYTYNSSNIATYGTLPTPPAETYPENYVFAGWYTEKDGKGTRIAADTEILPQSMTVYPKFEPAVDTLTVKTPPTKTTYTVGEKINTTGLVLSATVGGQTIDVPSGYYITPEYANTTAGTQTITAHYGGKTATFTVAVSDGDDKNIVVNGATHAVKVANNNYTINYQAPSPFNRYEMTYFSDSYVKGEIVMDGVTEEFFLEPSNNGTFASYIDSFLRGVNHYNVDSIKFTCLDKEYGNFELLSLTTIAATIPSNATQYYENAETGYKVGIDLSFGGVVSEVYDLDHPIVSRVYNIGGKNVTKVDYAERLDADYGTNYISQKTENINLINKFDRGRYLQQSYYGTSQKPYEMGDYNGTPWPYNPVQGGNLIINNADGTTKGNEASKVIDYRITNEQIYIKTRPLDWGKNSVDYPDSYVTDSYMEAWYVFEDGMIKTYCRFVDYSGYPTHTRDQELPAVYIIEPLNHFVYNPVADGSEWSTTNFKNIEEPDFWGVLPEYNALLQEDGKPTVDPTVDCYENWAAFTASDNAASFGVGVYSAGVTDFHYGCFYPKYSEEAAKSGQLVATENRHAVTTDPATENPTSYISPVDDMTFESYKPIEYSYYLTTGNANEIYTDFKNIANKESQADLDKPKIAVPETVYMTPADGASKVGQYYVNNLLDTSNSYNIITEAERDAGMYLGLHVKDAATFSVKITNVTDPNNDIFLCNTSGSEISESTRLSFDATDTFTNNTTYGLRFSGTGLNPGEKATAKWEITVYLDSGATETYTAYTVMYAPHRTVGSVAEGRQNSDSQNEISSWITGANGVDHSTRIALGSFHADVHDSGYFIQDPLIYGNTPPTISGSGRTSHDYINTTDPSEMNDGGVNQTDDYSENAYVLQAATDDHDSSRAHSYLGLLTVDKSRYSNTNQIPNLRIGYDVLRIGSATNNSVGKYATFYTLGTADAFVTDDLSKSPSGWTTFTGEYTDFAGNHNIPYRESLIPEFDVSTIDGKYIHALGKTRLDSTWADRQYSTAGTSVLCSVTDKSALRDTVMDGYGLKEDDYSEDSYNKFLEELEDAATVLGDPSASQDEIDQANKELTDIIEKMTEVYYSLKYDNLFSAYEFSQYANSMTVVGNRGTVSYKDGTLTVVNNTITGGEAYTNYGSGAGNYLIDLNPNTEYVFEYTSETTLKAQAFMFFYNNNGGVGDVPTNMSIKVNDGNWSPKSESNAWWGNYQNSAGTNRYAIKFTTGANTYKAGFRFGNTSNDPVTSTFSNIKLIDAAHYYEDATYSKTEDVYKKYASYGTLVTPVRPGYTFNGWKDVNGNTVTGANIAEENLSIYSQWTAAKYTITYNANGGSVSPASQNYTITSTDKIPTPTRNGYIFGGWKVTASDGLWTVGDIYQPGTALTNMYGNVTLTAQWTLSEISVYFDTILDFSKWNTTSAGNATISNVTDNGFTLTSNAGAGEGTSESPEFPVTAGKQYYIDIDFTGNNWDVYIFFRNETTGGTGINFADSTNRFSSNGAGNPTRTFTAPAGATKAVIRVDANGSSNSVTFSDIRVYEATTCAPNVNVPDSNKKVQYGTKFGALPVPTREGYTFAGWYDGNTLITAESTVTQTSTVYLKSKWVINDSALLSDTVVVDFATPITIEPFANDTPYNAESNTKKFLGITADGTSTPAASVAGTYGTFTVSGETTVTYVPTKAVSGTEMIYYHASVTADGVTTYIKSAVTVAPASNVLYEENVFETALSGRDWSTVGTTATVNQEASTDKDVYGYDGNTSGYNKIADYSNGSALTVTVDATNKRSKNLKFDFAGKGFDLIGACGPDTGVLVVSLKNNDTGKMVKSYIVDTYYSDIDGEGLSRYGDTLYQVPLISESGLDYADYTIQIIASYLPSMSGALNTNSVSTQTLGDITVNTAAYAGSEELYAALAEADLEYVLDAESVEVVWFDDDSVLNGGEGATAVSDDDLSTQAVTSLVNVVDSVRVYHPIKDGDAYYIPSERKAQYYNIIGNLISADANGTITGVGDSNFAYISGKDEETISFDTYNEVGPKDELYLAGGKGAVTFSIKDFDKTTTRVMISLRAATVNAVNGKPVAKFGDKQIEVISNTEMFYDITDYVADKGTVAVQNGTLGTLLSVGSVKITSTLNSVVLLSSDFDLATAAAMMMAPAKTVEPNTPVLPDEPEVPEVTEPEVTEPEVTVPETTVPEITEPEVTVPETTVPEITEPEVTVPETTVPEVTEPEVTVPETTVPEVTEPEVTVPETTVPEATEPEITVPETTVPETTVPEVTEPEVTVPETTVPEVTEPEVSEPDETEPSTENNTSPEDTTENDDEDDSIFVKIIKFIVGLIKKLVAFIVSIFVC